MANIGPSKKSDFIKKGMKKMKDSDDNEFDQNKKRKSFVERMRALRGMKEAKRKAV